MNKLDLIKKYLNRVSDFDSYYGMIHTNYGVSFYISINPLELSTEDLTFDGECGVSASSFNPILAISAMEVLFGKSDKYVMSCNEDLDEILYEVCDGGDVRKHLYELNEDLILRMIRSKDEVINRALDMMNDKEYESLFPEDKIERLMVRLDWIKSIEDNSNNIGIEYELSSLREDLNNIKSK
jgi:hypothetical protein